jgi:hypothetical protein
METKSATQEEAIETNGKKEIKRSASYPALTVLDALSFATKINDKFSTSVEVTRDEIGHVFGLHPNTVSRDVAACSQYGLLHRAVTGKYKLTDLFIDIHQPESEKDKRLKLITSFGTPKLYQELIAKFDNQVIPLELPNTLLKHHGITEAASKAAAETFIQSGQQVGVINESRALKYQVTLSTVSKTQYAEIVEENNDNQTKNSLPAKVDANIIQEDYVPDNNKKVPIYLTKDKTAYLVYPNEITANDISIIDHQLKGILLRIQLENQEKNKGAEAPQ